MHHQPGSFPRFTFRDPEAEARSEESRLLLLAAVLGAFLALMLGVYGSVHEPANDLAITLGFATTISMKVWLATFAAGLAVVQLLGALWMYGRLPLRAAPAWVGPAHRITGRLAFILTLPVAYHCLYVLGFQDTTGRALLHSVFGCVFYGAFCTKVVAVRSHHLPGWALPLVGGLLLAVLVLAWWTSGLWYVREQGFPAI